MSIIQHSSRTDAWYTPLEIVEASKDVLGTITLDPASCIQANKNIGAEHIFSKEFCGLKGDWPSGSVFLNPPGGKDRNKSMAIEFWKKLMSFRESGKLTHAIFMSFSVEHLQTSQGKGCKSMLDKEFTVCVPKSRVKFLLNGTDNKVQPSHSNAIIYVPGTTNRTNKFVEVFSKVGDCK